MQPFGVQEQIGLPVILPVLPSDLDRVFHIAKACFPVPWTREAFEEEFLHHWAVMRVIRPSWGEKPCGFIDFWVVHREIQLHNIAVLAEMQRKGYGRALMMDMLQVAEKHLVRTVYLEVRRSNLAALNLYESLGFEKVGIRPRYYSDNHEDAFIMLLRI